MTLHVLWLKQVTHIRPMMHGHAHAHTLTQTHTDKLTLTLSLCLSLSLLLLFSLPSLSLPQVTPGLGRLAMKLLGPCTFSQAALPHIFENVPRSYYQRNMEIFEKNAEVCYQMLKDVPGISPIMPAGAMYMMVSYK